MKRIFIFALLQLLFEVTVFAQIDEIRANYEKFQKQARTDFENFRKQANNEYSEFVRQAWEQFHALPSIPKPKDETIPPVVLPDDDKDKPIESKPVVIDDVITPPAPEPQPVPVAPIREQPEEDKVVDFIFYGTACSARLSDKAKFSLGDCGYEKLAAAWDVLSADGVCNNTIRDCLELRIRLQLSDWAYLNMLNSLAVKAFGDTNEATFLMAYIYCQSGYSMRLALADNRLYMLFASKHAIYDTGYFNIGGVNFYPFNCKADEMQICEAAFPDEKPLSLLMATAQSFAYKGSGTRTLTSERYPNFTVQAQVNKNLIDFYNTYPTSQLGDDFMTRWAMYANTPMEKEVSESLYPALRQQINGLTEKEAVERLLNWVQTAFTYEYDDKVWGCDRAFFAEETLYYPYCDCEDRSILLTRIVRDLLGLDCILIYYPGHLASAVCFNEQVNGDYIQLNGKRFVVCDGTYIGAPIGMTMPGMDNKTAKVILLE